MISDFFASRKAGYYVALAAAVLSIVAAIVYVCGYNDTQYMSWTVFVLALIAPVAFVALSLFKWTENWAAPVMGIVSFAAFLMFIHTVYLYLSEVFFAGVSWEAMKRMNPFFVFSLLFLLLSVVLSNVAIYMKQSKKNEEKEQA